MGEFINAKFPTNKLIVKPIPVRTETAYTAIQFELFGFCAKFNFTAIYANRNTPICFPKNKPHKIPRGTGLSHDLKLIPSNETPALANAKRGIIPKATYGAIECSNFNSNDLFLSFLSCGIKRASSTPAIVA